MLGPRFYIYSARRSYRIDSQCLSYQVFAGHNIAFSLSSATMSFLQLNHTSKDISMAVKSKPASEPQQSDPWVETPLRESYTLSEAAGWYGHTSSILIHHATAVMLALSLCKECSKS